MIALAALRPDERGVLDGLLQLYVYDLSDTLALDLGGDGRFRTPPVDELLGDPRAHAFLIRVDGRLAGFALVRGSSRLTGDERVRDVAEFFVLRRYRRRGVGEHVARELFDRFPGPWEVRQKRENRAATEFWRRVIARYTDGRFVEETLNDARWRGPVQRFDSAR